MKEKITQDDLDNLADIIWWIKGYLAAPANECPFGTDHINSLRKVRCNEKSRLHEDVPRYTSASVNKASTAALTK